MRLIEDGSVWFAESGPRRTTTPSTGITFGVADIDTNLPHGGLPFSQIHEWFYNDGDDSALAPLSIITFMTQQALCLPTQKNKHILWIGKKIWPTPYILYQVGGAPLLARSLFINPPNDESAFWSTVQALGASSIAVVVTTLRNAKLPATKKLTAAAAHGGSLGIVIRSPEEITTPSAAHSRWLIKPRTPSDTEPLTEASHFTLSLIGCKGSHPKQSTWNIELTHGTQYEAVSFSISPDVVDKSRRTEMHTSPQGDPPCFEDRESTARTTRMQRIA
jgi:hypothetical protein